MDANSNGIAIIGMSGRFPGAVNVDEFWRNLMAGVESISFFTEAELGAPGPDADEFRREPSSVAARGVIREAEWFDAAFFNISAKEAEITDPQQRLFLEASWEVLENAGYDPGRVKGYVGVYAGMSGSTYFLNNLYSHSELIKLVGKLAIGLGNEKDFLATRVAYKLNLKGPVLSINTACSTSLVAVCQACLALLAYQCDLALAGGVSVSFPQKRATYYQDGGMLSPDGHCRPFDTQAAGTAFSDGLGIVVLKRLAEALNDGDQIYAVIKGFGLNNDGAAKVGFTAPSVDGQAEVIALALAQAGIEPASISYIEAHGTATPLGDPIEIAGLTKAFRAGTAKSNFCAIGSVKSNIGHLDAAAGVAGLIKTALALKHKVLPPSLHFREPNPKIEFANSPFFVNSKLTEWKAGPTPRRAGVSAFGFGGTNAHVVLEEAPTPKPSSPSRAWQLLLLSAKTASALDTATANLLLHLKANPDLNLSDAAFTLQSGRRVFNHRRMLVCRDVEDAIQMLEESAPKRIFTKQGEVRERPVVFMFPGQGAQYVNMGAELYRTEAVFKECVDRCSDMLLLQLSLDLRQVLYPPAEKVQAAEELLIQTRITQPALFVIEYALAKLWMSWGVKPSAMIGHSVGEYVAGCLAGVFTLEAAVGLVAGRAQLVQAQPGGAMLAVRLPEKEMLPFLTGQLSIATVNSPALCVVSGPCDAVAELEARLKKQGAAARHLQTSHAFHSAMMDPVLEPLTELLSEVHFKKPSIPYVSNVTGRWITDVEAMDPKYWADHIRRTVRFADGVGELLKDPENILLEVGPGQILGTLVKQHPAWTAGQVVLSSSGASKDKEVADLLTALGKLWLAGATVDWSSFYKHEKRLRVTLPSYPFERKRYWIEPARPIAPQQAEEKPMSGPAQNAMPSPPLAPALEVKADATGEGLGSKDALNEAAPSRKQRVLAMLTIQFQELSSANLTEVGPSASFMEMGLDSLFLVQASQAIAKRFGIRITFRQLLQEMTTLNELADFLDQKMPPDALLAVAPPALAAPAEVSAPASGRSDLAAIEAQLQALSRQLELLRQAVPDQSSTATPARPASSVRRPAAVEPEETQAVRTEPSSGIALKVADTERMEVLRLSESQVDWPKLTSTVAARSEPGPLGWDRTNYTIRWRQLDQLTAGHAVNTLVALGEFASNGARASADDLVRRHEFVPRYRDIVGRWLSLLARAGILREETGTFVSPLPLRRCDLSEIWSDVKQLWSDDPVKLAYIRLSSERLIELLTGRVSPLEVLAEVGLFEPGEGIYERKPSARYMNAIAAAAVRSAWDDNRGPGPFRLLEAGAGTGATTSQLAEFFSSEDEYWFTDLSDAFLTRARRRFGKNPAFRFAKFNLDLPLSEELPAEQMNVVLAANVVHATRDVGATLDNLRALLKPGGLLVLIESTTHHSYLDLTVAFVEGWSNSSDAYRSQHPLLTADQWVALLHQRGFIDAERFPRSGANGDNIGQHIVIARNSLDPRPRPTAVGPEKTGVECYD